MLKLFWATLFHINGKSFFCHYRYAEIFCMRAAQEQPISLCKIRFTVFCSYDRICRMTLKVTLLHFHSNLFNAAVQQLAGSAKT